MSRQRDHGEQQAGIRQKTSIIAAEGRIPRLPQAPAVRHCELAPLADGGPGAPWERPFHPRKVLNPQAMPVREDDAGNLPGQSRSNAAHE